MLASMVPKFFHLLAKSASHLTWLFCAILIWTIRIVFFGIFLPPYPAPYYCNVEQCKVVGVIHMTPEII